MKKVLIAYDSRTGHTEKMANYIAEGIRMGDCDIDIKKITVIKKPEDIMGYDAYIFGSPTYHRDMINSMKTFLFLAEKANLQGKIGGAFGSYTHSGDAPKIIFETMQYVFKMEMSELGSLNLKENIIDQPDGMRACQEYGKAICKRIS